MAESDRTLGGSDEVFKAPPRNDQTCMDADETGDSVELLAAASDRSDRTFAPDVGPPARSDQTLDLPAPPAARSDRTFDLPAPEHEPSDRTIGVDGVVAPRSDQTMDLPAEPSAARSDQTMDLPAGPAAGHGQTVDLTGPSAAGSDRTGEWTVNTSQGDGNLDLSCSGTVDLSEDKPVVKIPAKQTTDKAGHFAGYEILKELGRGAMGVVYKARQTALNRMVALKMVLTGAHASPKEIARFQIEAEAVARLQHPNIVQIYEIGEADGKPFFSLEFVDGGTLTGLLDGKPLGAREAAGVVQQLAQAMDCAHRCGIVHRDLKPENILLSRKNGKPIDPGKKPSVTDFICKVSDFGLAKRLEEDSKKTNAGSIMGTPSYMAPEQAEGRNADVGPPADIYALGAILYDLLTGRPPFQGRTILETLQHVRKMEPTPPRKHVPNLPRDLDTICLKCLQKEPAKRYLSAADLGEDLRRFLEGEPITARPVGKLERTWKWCKRKPAQAALVAVSAIGVIAMIAGGFAYGHQQRQQALKDRQQALKDRQQAEIEAGLKKEAVEQRILAEKNEQKAIEQRKRAEQNFDSAQEAVDQMLTRVGQKKLAGVPQGDVVRRELVLDALRFQERFLKDREGDPDQRFLTAQAFRRVGNLRSLLNEQEQADKAYTNALAMFDALAREFKSVTKYRKEWAAAANQFALLLREAGQKDKAEVLFRQSVEAWQGLLNEAIKNEDARAIRSVKKDLAATLSNLGVLLLAKGQRGEANKYLGMSLDMKKTLADDNAAEPAYRLDLGNGYVNYAVKLQTNNQLPEAALAYGQALEILRTLADSHPKDQNYQEDYLRTLTGRGSVFLQQGKLEDAENDYRTAVARVADLATKHPDVPIYQFNWAQYEVLLATLLQMQPKKVKDAEPLHRSALNRYRPLVDNHSSEPDYRFGQIVAMKNLADFLRLTKRTDEAMGLLAEALSHTNILVSNYPGRPVYAQEQAKVLHTLGLTLKDQKKLKDAEQMLENAVQVRQKLIKDYPKEQLNYLELAGTLGELAITQAAGNKLDKAEETFRMAIETLDPLYKQGKDQPACWQEEFYHQDNLAKLLGVVGKDQEAKKCQKRIAELKQKLAKAGNKG